jgi:hypothetical protein
MKGFGPSVCESNLTIFRPKDNVDKIINGGILHYGWSGFDGSRHDISSFNGPIICKNHLFNKVFIFIIF